MPAIVYVARPNGVLSFLNPAWTRFSGIAVDSVLEQGWPDVLHPADTGWVTEAWERAMASATAFCEEFRIRDCHGEYRWVISHAVPTFSDGSVACWYGTILPIDERRTAERALESFADAIPQLVMANDALGGATHVNYRWLEYTGLTFAESLGRGWLAALHPDDGDMMAQQWSDALLSGTFDALRPFRLRGRDGLYRWFVVRAVAVRDENGAIVRWYATATDVDDQVRAVQRRTILDRLGAAFAESLEFERTARTVVSAMCEEFADFAFVDVVGERGALDRIAAEGGRLTADADLLKRFAPPPHAGNHPINVVLRSGAPHIVSQCDDDWLRSTTWCEEHYAFARTLPLASVVYVPMIAAGERIGVLTFGAASGTGRSFSAADIEDVLEVARRAAVALANARLYRDLALSEARYRGIIDTAQEGLWIVDAEHRTRYVNARMTQILGYDPDAMYGRSIFDFIAPSEHDEARRALGDHFEGQGYRGESRLRHADGHSIAVIVASNPLFDADGVYAGSLGMFTDITERKAIETHYRVLARTSDVLSRSLDLETLLGRFADLLVGELAEEATVTLREGRVVVRRNIAGDAGSAVVRVPLRHRDVELGVVTLRRTAPFAGEDDELLEQVAARAAVAIENAQLYEREHRVAVTLQRAMLPAVLPTVEGAVFDAVYYPGATEAEIGGDWYDAIALPDGRVVVSIGDVTGRGLTAAVIMGRMRQAVEALATYESDPVRLLNAADRVLRRAHPDAIVTALVGVYDPAAATLTYATAGHPTPMVRAADGTVRQLPGRGLPLGLRDGMQPPATTAVLPPASVVVFFTDGLVESTRDIVEGERRLVAALRHESIAHARAPAAMLVARVLEDGARDDVAVLTMRTADAAPAEPPWSLRWRFDARESVCARDVRETLLEALAVLGSDADPAAMQLVFGELVGNAVRHAPGDVEVELTWDEVSAPVLHVCDEGPGYVAADALPAYDAESGRGLFLVRRLTREFSVGARAGHGACARAVLLTGS